MKKEDLVEQSLLSSEEISDIDLDELYPRFLPVSSEEFQKQVANNIEILNSANS